MSKDCGSQGTCFDMIDVEEKCDVFGKLTEKISMKEIASDACNSELLI